MQIHPTKEGKLARGPGVNIRRKKGTQTRVSCTLIIDYLVSYTRLPYSRLSGQSQLTFF